MRTKWRRWVDSLKALSQVSSCFIDQDIVLFFHHFLPTPISHYWSCKQNILLRNQKICNRNPEQALKDPLRRILDPWEETERLGVQSSSKKLVFVVTSILSSTSILLFHFLPLHSHFLSGLLVMLFYLGNIEQDTQDLQICMNNIEKMFATDSFCYN